MDNYIIFSENTSLLKGLGLGFMAMGLIGCAQEKNPLPEKPNIIVILADDMGYSDISCYGGEIPTPNIDRLAENGMRFTQYYNSARCCPTRAALLTGLYPHQAGVGAMVSPNDERPGYLGRLNESCVTLAEALKLQGYQTFMSGKWHVSHFEYQDPEPTLHPPTWPVQRGFDRFFGTLAGAGSLFDPVSLMEGNEFIEPWDDFYYTEAITKKAVQFIQEAGEQNPFFLYIAHVAPHWPMHARPGDIQKFEGAFNKGWDLLREERYARMLDLGLIDEQWRLSPRDETEQPWEEAPHKEWEAHRMAVYAAMIHSMDNGIGEVIQALEAKGQLDNTLIVFLSDNGACAEVIRGTQTRHGYFPRGGTTPDIFPGGPDTYAAYGRAWANLGNTPYRRFKRWVHEGGIATPFIAHWPETIKPNQIVDHVAHIIDLMPTFLEMAGGEYPDSLDGNKLTPLEGISFLPTLKGLEKEQIQHEALYWEHIGYYAIRHGNWKLVAEGDQWELFDLEKDRTELNNLADTNPEIVKKLETMWNEWATRALVK
jgi:arylsulfatase A-like enzyme